ncbi:MAG: hypothetical protein NTW98_01185 [Candidatus Nomurabacteria bacterium]|nr:hypothetical protein [Candidatus Nomurabacteria bacterium]
MKTDIKKIIKISSISLFFLFIIVFAFARSSDLIFGVKIKNVNIVDGQRYEQEILEVTGNAKNAKNLTLNGREISINKEGDFEETIALLSGYNIITIRAEDKFGHVDEKDYQIIQALGN